MAEVEAVPTLGVELKDAFRPVNAWVANGIAWLDDIQQFYRERSVIEKEHSAKLNGLAKKYLEKKAKRSSSLSVGETPQMTPGSLESASLTTWNIQLSTLESIAAEHDRFSVELVSRLADPLKHLGAKYEEIRKRHADYAAKLERERDASYGELRKFKASYDSVCQDVEARRKKVDSALESSKPKAQNAFQQQMLDMNNAKNTYLIGISITNVQKEKYYHEYVPELLDNLQDLSETRTARLNSVWSLATEMERSMLSRNMESLQFLSSEIPRNNPSLDSIMFIRHNISSWQEPADMVFEPSPVWHDDASMAVDDNAKIFLRNLMGKSKAQLGEMKTDVDKKRREVENVKRIRASIRDGKDKRDEVEVVTAILSLQEELHRLDHKRLALEVETATIRSAVGDITRGARNHGFKPQTFKIPTNCDLCGDRIWGLSAKGFDCKDCGYTCHSKCEMKVPATCPGEQSKEERKKLKAERQEASHVQLQPSNGGPPEGVAEMPALSRSNTMSSLSSGYATNARRSVSGPGPKTPTEEASQNPAPARSATSQTSAGRRNRVIAPPPTQYVSELPANEVRTTATAGADAQRGKMSYTYQANGEGEITADEGNDVVVIEPDDGSGWIKVRTGLSEGLVPASYVELGPAARAGSSPSRPDSTYSTSSASVTGSTIGATKKKGPAVAPKKGAKKLHYVEALYDYEARSDAEWSMGVGDRFVVVVRDAGDGWAEVEKGGAVKSVPANYVQDVS
ncbi:MAG: hypothetical protein M1815_004732 [Lichina confinis]|nr:MAG: hypothetical protein M1815_004732 [Lichina confinis]